MSDQTLILLALSLPLIFSGVIAITGANRNLRDTLMVASAAVLFIVVLSVLPSVLAGARPAIELFDIMPGLALGFAIEPLGMIFALVASGLWVLTSIYGIG